MCNRISPLAALIAFSIATVILAQGITAPFVKDAEPQAAAWIQDVASGNHILLPRDYYGELARKPPLFYWVAGALTAATGGRVDEVRARMVSVLVGAYIALLVLIWTATFLGSSAGWLAFLFLLGSYAFTSRGTLALEDMLLAAFMFTAWCLLYPTIEEGPSHRTIVAIGVASGLGILTKGPVAIALPAFGAVIYLLLTRRSIATQMHRRWPWAILAISIMVALLWYVPALLVERGALVRIIFQENVGHFLPPGAGGTGEAARPFYYIAIKLLGGSLPPSFLLPALAVALIRGEFATEAYRPLIFQLSFLVAILICFSVASAKRDDYVMPGIPSMAILFAALFTSLRDARIAQRLRDVTAIGVAAMAVGGSAAAAAWSCTGHSSPLTRMNPIDRAYAHMLNDYVCALGPLRLGQLFVVVGCAALILSGVRYNYPTCTAAGLGSLSLLGVLTFTAVLRPEMARERTLKYAAADISRVARNAPIYVINENQELSFYLGRRAPQIVGTRDTARSVEPSLYLFAYRGDFRRVAAQQLCNDKKLIQQWDRLGGLGKPALYQIPPECVKPQFALGNQ
jgi:hypothetical protein